MLLLQGEECECERRSGEAAGGSATTAAPTHTHTDQRQQGMSALFNPCLHPRRISCSACSYTRLPDIVSGIQTRTQICQPLLHKQTEGWDARRPRIPCDGVSPQALPHYDTETLATTSSLFRRLPPNGPASCEFEHRHAALFTPGPATRGKVAINEQWTVRQADPFVGK